MTHCLLFELGNSPFRVVKSSSYVHTTNKARYGVVIYIAVCVVVTTKLLNLEGVIHTCMCSGVGALDVLISDITYQRG